MRRVTLWTIVVLGLALCAHPSEAQTKENPGFGKLKTLAGEWEGKTESGQGVAVSYRVVSGGTALLETLRLANEPGMVTLYTADGDRVVVTHYCSANNQPRMRTAPIGGSPRKLDFSFVDATNLSSPSAGHMQRLVVTIEDNDHLTQVWTLREKGADKSETFHYTRKKAS